MMSVLSEDLVEEILSRVPTTSLKRLRSTCKQWNALFSNHRFTKKHFDKASKELLVFMLANLRVYSMSHVNLRGILNNIDPSIEVKGELGLLNSLNYKIFHCNGLLLCTRLTWRDSDRLVVYNPCTGQTKWIEPRRIKPGTVYKHFDTFALGYQINKSCSSSYKILRFRCDEYSQVVDVEFEIYEFNSNSWRVLDDVTHDWHLAKYGRGVSLKGNTYWIASDKNEEVDSFLLNFDFTKERFQRLRLPFECDCDDEAVVLSTVREEKLAVLFENKAKSKMEIWLTNKIDESNDVSWRMLFKVGLDDKYMFALSMSFIVDEENKVAVCCDKSMEEEDAIIFIVAEDNKFRQVDLLGEFAFRPIRSPFLFSYVPSLVQIE